MISCPKCEAKDGVKAPLFLGKLINRCLRCDADYKWENGDLVLGRELHEPIKTKQIKIGG